MYPARLSGAKMQGTGVDDNPVKLPVETKCKTAKLEDATPAGAGSVATHLSPSELALVLPAVELDAKLS
jgi:hypothetical protein